MFTLIRVCSRLALCSAFGLCVLVAVGRPTTAHAADALDTRTQQLFAAANGYWAREFVTLKAFYQAPTLGFDAHALPDGCSEGAAVVGPFYCPDESRVYLSEDFLKRVQSTAGAAADLALAYIVGHEIGSHIQDLIGTTEQVEKARANSTPALSTRTWTVAKLQADCYAGLTVRDAQASHLIAHGDVAAALAAVAKVSHATQASLARGEVQADPMLSYGSSAQQLAWFQHGLDGGKFTDCDTFAAEAAGKL